MDSSNLDTSIETEGFNLECGKTWIYPTNLPIRDYQYNIVKEALFKNTMVCLPTGLGKTFIAAVVMYNYYRWYPQGKIIFMAPTKPLVAQQIDACFNITAIPKETTAELTGITAAVNRSEEWRQKRVFFITPQVLQNDINKITELGTDIKCLVFDEAHRARGKYAYCEIIRHLTPVNKNFRVLALSATPGSNIIDVIKVCKELLISHIEMRTEQSADVSQYVFKRSLETVLIPIGPKLTEIREKYLKILDRHLRPLVKHNLINGNYNQLTKGRLFYMLQEHKNRQQRGPAYNEIGKCLNIGIQLYHAYDLLIRHGLRGFYKYFQDLSDKPLLKHDMEIHQLVEEIMQYLGPIPCIDKLPDGSLPKIPEETIFGHPKFYKLESILTDHFQKNSQSKAIVFCEFVESVIEAYTILIKQHPLIKPSMFLGQSNIGQRKQIQILESFRTGLSNVLVSTCIGEEGLDIGEVDLVICFDINNKSTIRMVQRMGRTGRKREGRVVVLVTEGKEHTTLQECLRQKSAMTNNILHCKNLQKELYSESPKMVPEHINSVCSLMHFTITKSSPKKKKLKNSLFDTFLKRKNDDVPTYDVPIRDFNNQIPTPSFYFPKEHPLEGEQKRNFFNSKIENQRSLQSSFGQIGASSDSKLLVNLLSFADSRRFNIPLTQSDIFNKTKKQGDIRTMFLKQTLLSQTTGTATTVNKTNDLDFNKEYLHELNTEISNLIYTSEIINKNCKFCENFFTCNVFSTHSDSNISQCPIPPSFDIIEILTEENMNLFLNNQKNLLDTSMFQDDFDDLMAQVDISEEQAITAELNRKSDILLSPTLKAVSNFKANQNISQKQNLSKPKFAEKDSDDEIPENMDKFIDKDFISPKQKSNIQYPKSAEKILEQYSVSKELSDIFEDDFLSDFLGESIDDKKNCYKTFDNIRLQQDTLKNTQESVNTSINIKNELSEFIDDDFLCEFFGENSHNEVISENCVKCSKNEGFEVNRQNDTILQGLKITDFPAELLQTKTQQNSIDNSYQETSVSGVNKQDKFSDKLNFVKLNSSNELFESNPSEPEVDLDATIIWNQKSPVKSNKTPTLPESPILSSFESKIRKKQGAHRKLFGEHSFLSSTKIKDNETQESKLIKKNYDSSEKLSVFEETSSNKILENEDIFDDSILNMDDFKNKTPDSKVQNTEGISPDLFDSDSKSSITYSPINDVIEISDSSQETSPVLSSNARKKSSSNISFKFNETVAGNEQISSKCRNKNESPKGSKVKCNLYKENSIYDRCLNDSSVKPVNLNLNINDICDNSILDILDCTFKKSKEVIEKNDKKFNETINTSLQKSKSTSKNISMEDLFDDSILGDLINEEDHHFNILPQSNKENLSQNKTNTSINLGVNCLAESQLALKTNLKPQKKYGFKLKDVSPSNCSQINNSSTYKSSQLSESSDIKNKNLERSCSRLELLNESINNGCNSEEEFETSFIKPKKRKVTQKETFKKPTIGKQMVKKCDFLDIEAEVSSDGEVSDDEQFGSEDEFEKSFVNDETQNMENTILSQYLKATKSPILHRGKFKIPTLPQKINESIFSQAVDRNPNETYMNDSFCVDSEDMEMSELDLSELEIAELRLKEMKKSKKRKSSEASSGKIKKKRRIIVLSDDSD